MGIAMERFAVDVLERADREQATLVVFRLDTPGGLVSSMRESPRRYSNRRFRWWWFPERSESGLGRAFILQAAHVACGAGHNAGAAQPVMASGKDAPDTDMKKITNDLPLRSGPLPS